MNRRTWFKKTATVAGGVILAPYVPLPESGGVILTAPGFTAADVGRAITINGMTAPNLQRGVIQQIINRGSVKLMSELPFKHFTGSKTGFDFSDMDGYISFRGEVAGILQGS